MYVFSDYDVEFVVGVGGDADAAALADGEVVEAAVLAEGLVVVGADDGAGAVGHVFAEEVGHLDVADEADALGVFFLGVGEAGRLGEFAELGLEEVAHGEAGAGDLVCPHLGEEVGLVFVGIGSFDDGAGLVFGFADLGVVPGGDFVEAVFKGVVEEDAEFDLAVAHDVRVGRDAGLVAGEEIVDDAGAVFLHEVDHAEGNAEGFGDGGGVLDVLLPRAVAEDLVLVDPVFHVGAFDGVALLFEEQGGDGGVDASGHGN